MTKYLSEKMVTVSDNKVAVNSMTFVTGKSCQETTVWDLRWYHFGFPAFKKGEKEMVFCPVARLYFHFILCRNILRTF